MTNDKRKNRKSHTFNRGIWYAIQELVYLDEPTLAKNIARAANINKEEARYLQKGSGFLDDVMKDFISKELS